MSKYPERVRVTLSHNQELDGTEREAGESISIDARLARALKARGAVQIEKTEKRFGAPTTTATAEKGDKR